ncbi:hypothetical protein LOD99_7688 [Oopsacas minuta]|uniref:Uncharacterized protein n=1 Tax=Oopsacas minuta TaxID=111878 RepID=A0AAV7JNT9_9METZ|nr:hypothetical protein LOD99_7688 [Oopsacas minuta]
MKTSFKSVMDTTISGAERESKNVRVNVSGAEPGYVVTSCMCVSSAITILEEKDIIQSSTKRRGGVLTPGFAFEKTTLVERLNKSQKVLFETKEV